eukprot:7012977-Pyramimonas_sp.AAC.1
MCHRAGWRSAAWCSSAAWLAWRAATHAPWCRTCSKRACAILCRTPRGRCRAQSSAPRWNLRCRCWRGYGAMLK